MSPIDPMRLPASSPCGQSSARVHCRRVDSLIRVDGLVAAMARLMIGAIWIGAMILAGGSLNQPASVFAADRPNVVVIMTDNHGAWTLGCYGNQDIRTPNIDRLAAEGTRFTRAFASNPVCSPTRATFLTGLVPSQHGVHCFLFGGRLQMGPNARNTLDDFTSLPEVLQDSGYSCGLVGKWHLGDNLNPQEGFEDYWITMPHGGTSTFYDAQIIEDGKLRNEPQYLTDFWTKHAVKFIDQSVQETEKPFFLFLAYNGPYSLSRLLLRDGRNRHANYYADRDLPSFPREPAHPWQLHNLDYHNNPVSIRRVATEVSGVDDGVGTVMKTLKNHGIDDDTIVIFLADQGWSGGHGGFFGMGDHTRPTTAYDAMMQIPMIWRQPGRVLSNNTSNQLVANYDVMPTLLSQLGLADQMPIQPQSPGRDFSQALSNPISNRNDSTSEINDDAIFYEFEGLRCIRTERWKYVHRHALGPHELYDLKSDPDEFNNLASDSNFAETRATLKGRLDKFYAKYSLAKYNMWQGGGSQTKVYHGIDEEVAQGKPAEPPALPSGFVVPEIKVPDGFTVELAAGPPLVQHPTFATFDDRGRLFVSENAGVNMSSEELEEKLPNSIRMLEDVDQDGRFDNSTVFADKMTFPMGGAWHDGALYVASPPNIWRLEDTDDDGVADKREVIVDRFGYTGNAASIHGCNPGPDGRLYWCDGYHGHEFKDEDGNVTSARKGSYIFSCLPDGSDVEIHCGGGMDNPVEVDFTNEGEMLGTVNIFYTRPRVDCLVHWLYGGAYPHREQVLSELQVTGDVLGPVHDFGHVAISGTTRYRSGVMDHRWRNNMFATFFNSGKVVRLEIDRAGSSFDVNQREFLTCESRDFHPTDVVEDADGSLLVVDTGGWFYRGCPTSQFAKPDVLGGIYRVKRQGMTTQIDPRGNKIDWSTQSDSDLVRLLGDTRFAVRQRAIAECAKRGGAITKLLRQTLKRGDILPRRGSAWALTRIVGSGGDEPTRNAAAESIRFALADRHPSIRQAACRSISTYPDPLAIDRLQQLLRSDTPSIQREAATAMGRVGDSKSVQALLAALENPIDRTQEHAIIFALIEINDAEAIRKALATTNPSSRISRGGLLALDQMDDGNLTIDEVVAGTESTDAELQIAAAQIFNRHDEWRDRSAEVIRQLWRQWQPSGQSGERKAGLLRKLLTRSLTDEAVGRLVGRTLDDESTPKDLRDLVLASIANARNVRLHESWSKPLDRLLQVNSTTTEQTIAAVASIKTDRFQDQLRRLGADESLSVMVRVAALQAASSQKRTLDPQCFELLIETLDGNPAESLQAAQKIGSSELNRSQLINLAPKLESAGPSQLQELIRVYQRSRDPQVAAAFLNAMQNARQLTSLSPTQFSDTIKRYPHELLPKANQLLKRIEEKEQAKLARLDALLPLLEKGDVQRGRKLFFSEKSKCSTCHRVAEKGGLIGPDLTNIGANRAGRDLLESIVFPSSTIVRDYEPYTVLTIDGRVFSGLVARETADELHLQQQTGEPVMIPRDEIEEIAASSASVMPSGLEESLTETELANVIAYLKSLKQS